MLEIPVELGPRRYVVSVGHGLTATLESRLGSFRGRRMVVVASRRVWALHGRRLRRSLLHLGPFHLALIPDGERYKTRATLERLYTALLRAGLGRDGFVLAFGGGVVGDVAGFAAATYMRGIDWVVLPTTLLAMVDSAIGGKVGVNLREAKNLVGAFHQPRAVVADTALLSTLPRRELRSGAYEVLKCGLLGDRALVEALARAPADLGRWDAADLESAVAAACRIKAEVVGKDEREADLRRVLNLGHTLGHALEAATRYRRFTHGEAVGWGLVGASWIARRRGLLDEASHDAIARAVDGLGPRPRLSDIAHARILHALGRDKKARAGRIVFVLPTGIGRVTVCDDVSRAEVRHALGALAAREPARSPAA
jgi:3-dehydroquinate synthase